MDPLQPGETLDTFIIEKELHSSAMARLYQAKDLLTDEKVVLKAPFGDILNNPIQFYHYQNEERIGRTIDHRNLVHVFNRNRSSQYIIEEYIHGNDLRSMVGKGKKMEFSRAGPIILQIADALTYLHDRGIIHLDLKPENIIITPENKVKIIDFGFASKEDLPDLLAEDFSLPHGTPNYIAPEQIIGHRREKRSDIYSLGILLYEMLTGHLPFTPSTKLSKTRRRLKIDPVPPRYHDQTIAPQLQEIILKCLERQPEKRYDSASALARDLQNYQDLPVNDRGLNCKKPSILFSLLSPALSLSIASEDTDGAVGHKKYQILGAIIDDESANPVVEEIRKRALMHNAEVTLLTVIEEDDDSHFRRYGLAVEGERFRTRIEEFVQRFRRYNIDPTIRLVPGKAGKTILSVAKKIQADLLVLGPSRKTGLLGDSVVKTIVNQSNTEVLVAVAGIPEFAWSNHGDSLHSLTREQVLDIDLYLIDTWYHHVSWLADIALSLFKGSYRTIDLDPHHCFVGQWLAELRKNPSFLPLAKLIEPVHNDVHDMAKKMALYAESDDVQGMKQLYQESILPLSCSLRDQFIEASKLVRSESGHPGSPQLPSLTEGACPVFNQEIPFGGPLLQLHTVKSYLDSRERKQSRATSPVQKTSTDEQG